MKSTLASISLFLIISIGNNCVWGADTVSSQQIIENTTSISNLQSQIEKIEKLISSSHKSINQQHHDMKENYGQLKQMQVRTNTELNNLQDWANLSESNINDNLNKITQLKHNTHRISLDNYRNNKGSFLILFSLLFEIPAVIFLSVFVKQVVV